MLTCEQRNELAEDPRGFLRQSYRGRERIEAKRERIEQWRRLAESTTITLKETPGGSGNATSLVENCAVNIVDLERELAEEIKELVATERIVGQAIEMVDDPTDKALLELRYLNCLTWPEVAGRLGVTLRWVMTLHKNILERISLEAL